MDTYEKIKQRITSREINCEQGLEDLAKIGYCPNLMNDDNGHWAVKFDGFQNVPMGDEPDDIQSTCWIEKKCWKDSIYEALIFALED